MSSDASGVKYVYQAVDEATKNHRDDDDGYGGNMYACGGKMCPVYTFELYMKLLNDENTSLFQRPKMGYRLHDSKLMYDNAKSGRDTLGNMMSVMSKSAGLSKRYTNHCVRATCVSLLDENFDPTQIMGVSMHKSLTSILSYRGRVKKSKKRDMSMSLTRACTSETSTIVSNDVSVQNEPSNDVACTSSNEQLIDSLNVPDCEMNDVEVDRILQSIDMQQFLRPARMPAPVFNLSTTGSVVVHNHYHYHMH